MSDPAVLQALRDSLIRTLGSTAFGALETYLLLRDEKLRQELRILVEELLAERASAGR